MTFTIEIEGSFDKPIDSLTTQIRTGLEVAMNKATLAVLGIEKEYPSESAANHPGRTDDDGQPMGYYERNRGSWYPLKTPRTVKGFGKTTFETIRAKKAQRAQGVYAYRLNPTSEQLGKSWSVQIESSSSGIIGIIGTDVSYAVPVQGLAENQSALMKEIGWTNLDEAVEKAAPDISAAFQDVVDSLGD